MNDECLLIDISVLDSFASTKIMNRRINFALITKQDFVAKKNQPPRGVNGGPGALVLKYVSCIKT